MLLTSSPRDIASNNRASGVLDCTPPFKKYSLLSAYYRIILRAVKAAFLILAVVLSRYSQYTLKHADTYFRTSLPLTP